MYDYFTSQIYLFHKGHTHITMRSIQEAKQHPNTGTQNHRINENGSEIYRPAEVHILTTMAWQVLRGHQRR